MNVKNICNNYFKKIGKTVTLYTTADNGVTYHAVVSQTWRKNKAKFEESLTELGRVSNDYYIYLGPADYDICALGDEAYILCDGERFKFLKTERVIVGDKVQFFTAVLKKIWECDSNAFE
jgi:hypothetical protein